MLAWLKGGVKFITLSIQSCLFRSALKFCGYTLYAENACFIGSGHVVSELKKASFVSFNGSIDGTRIDVIEMRLFFMFDFSYNNLNLTYIVF